MIIKVKLADYAVGVPAYQTAGAAGFDIPAADDGVVYQQTTRIFRTGLFFEVPPGWELQIRSRSGLAAKESVFVANSPGTLDSDYRGELMIILHNLGLKDFKVKRGMRIAQAVLSPVHRAVLVQADELSETDRGEGGFGSTGA